MLSLSKLIQVDEEKCINCHQCIAVCPVKYCNDGSGETVKLNADLCIGCGECLSACTHSARIIIDDFDIFMRDISAGENIVAIVAPAVASNFPNNYLHLNGWLKSLGVKAIFDVSLGAELSIKSYLHHVKENKPECVISQPCPAIVSYIEIYKPELLKYLAAEIRTTRTESFNNGTTFEEKLLSPISSNARTVSFLTVTAESFK